MSNNETNGDLNVQDLQRRLGSLGYDLGDEAKRGHFGDRTATAVRAFKHRMLLPEPDVLDSATWAALKDATLTLGERLLYLHMPQFVGNDVLVLQQALSSLGFCCGVDGIFGLRTERATREFQASMALACDGIADAETCKAVERLRHSWEGRLGVVIDGHGLGSVREREVLEQMPICVFGTDVATRSIADRVSNLAQASTSKSQVISASGLSHPPGRQMLLVGLERACLAGGSVASEAAGETAEIAVCLDTADAIEAGQEIRAARKAKASRHAVDAAPAHGERITMRIASLDADKPASPYEEQRCAVAVLDALCAALA